METNTAQQPELHEGTPAEVFGIAADPDMLAKWEKALDGIEASERAAAAEAAAICSHGSH
jgi:hypothetical protein